MTRLPSSTLTQETRGKREREDLRGQARGQGERNRQAICKADDGVANDGAVVRRVLFRVSQRLGGGESEVVARLGEKSLTRHGGQVAIVSCGWMSLNGRGLDVFVSRTGGWRREGSGIMWQEALFC